MRKRRSRCGRCCDGGRPYRRQANGRRSNDLFRPEKYRHKIAKLSISRCVEDAQDNEFAADIGEVVTVDNDDRQARHDHLEGTGHVAVVAHVGIVCQELGDGLNAHRDAICRHGVA